MFTQFLGLGPTCKELDVSGLPVFPKTKFSMCIPEVDAHLKDLKGIVFPCTFWTHVALAILGHIFKLPPCTSGPFDQFGCCYNRKPCYRHGPWHPLNIMKQRHC